MKNVSKKVLEHHKLKIESDICSLSVDLEYYKVEGKGKKLVVMGNGGEVDYKKLIDGLENGILNLTKKLNIVNKLLEEI